MTKVSMVTRVERVHFYGVSHAIAYCTNVSRGLSVTVEFLVIHHRGILLEHMIA